MSEPLYDEEMLRRVALLAARLQLEREKQLLQPGQKLTAAEMDVIGEEMGLDPALMRQALGYIEAREESAIRAKARGRRQWILAGVALGLFVIAGGILVFKLAQAGVFAMPFANIPQINVTLKRDGEPSLDQVLEIKPGSEGEFNPSPASRTTAPVSPEVIAQTAEAEAAAFQRYLDWIKRSEAERAKLALRLVTYGQRMRKGYGGSADQTRPLAEAPVRELQEFRRAVESVQHEVPELCRTSYSSYRTAVQNDTREAEGLANAFFNWKTSDARKYGFDSTRAVLQRYGRPASDLESFIRSRNLNSDARIAVSEDTCLLRSLNFGMGNF